MTVDEVIKLVNAGFTAEDIKGMSNNTNIDKKGENLITDEISINEEYTNLSLQKRLDCINRHLDMFNDLYNQNLKAVENNTIKEVNSYEDIYGDANSESESLSKSDRTDGSGND